MYLLVPMQRELSLHIHRNNAYGHFEQVCKNQVSEFKVKVDTFYKIFLSALSICYDIGRFWPGVQSSISLAQ